MIRILFCQGGILTLPFKQTKNDHFYYKANRKCILYIDMFNHGFDLNRRLKAGMCLRAPICLGLNLMTPYLSCLL